MWPRVVEVMLGVWLLMSPFIFGHAGDAVWRWTTDLGCAAALITLALASYAPKLAYAHWFSVLIGLWLCGFGYFASPYPTPPALQNNLIVGLLVLMFAIIPNQAAHPPRAWRQVFEKEAVED